MFEKITMSDLMQLTEKEYEEVMLWNEENKTDEGFDEWLDEYVDSLIKTK